MNGRSLKLKPLRELFNDEVCEQGHQLGIPHDLVMRHPFPGPEIAIRVLGEVTWEQIAIARKADRIFIEEIRAAGLYEPDQPGVRCFTPCESGWRHGRQVRASAGNFITRGADDGLRDGEYLLFRLGVLGACVEADCE